MRAVIIHRRVGFKGGLETRLSNYTSWLAAKGYRVTVITSAIDNSFRLPEGTEILKVRDRKYPKPIREWFFNSLLEEAVKGIQADFILSLGRTSHQPHLIAPNTHKGYLRAIGSRALFPTDWMQIALDRKAYATSQQIFACSRMIAEEIQELYKIPAKKITVLYPPLDARQFSPGKESKKQLRIRLGLPTDKNLFLFVSTSHTRKGLVLLQDVFRDLHAEPVQLLVAGSPFLSWIPSVTSLGFVKYMPDLYRAADAVLLPALYEPFGQVVSEAIACGTPVLVGPKVGASEILTPDTGRVIPLDFLEWKHAIQDFDADNYPMQDREILVESLSLDNHMEIMMKNM